MPGIIVPYEKHYYAKGAAIIGINTLKYFKLIYPFLHKVCDGLGFGFPAIGKRDSEISLESRDISITCCKMDLCNMPVMSTTFPTTSTTTVHSGHGHCRSDILFILDDSGSVGTLNFHQMLNFVVSVINGLNIGISENHVAMITFSSQTHLEWNLNTYGDKQALVNATLRIRYVPGTTQTSQALHYARTNVFTPGAGDRQGFPNVAIILTDGQSTNPSQTATTAAALQQVAKVIAIGIGTSTDTNELHVIATDPDQQNVFLLRDFHELQNVVAKVISVLC
ncbi:hypothetical protein CHS0354_008848 [Potamilus streckersoni]|uniref:VWFA domain-containing protein n=1 Tax=Potamilus streckersoni TaxID=2493646 RepID=A0AAE0SLX4_9BIVA|nr:hypothetical protein CHS0354_008848 [Potamilus streckersoni]